MYDSGRNNFIADQISESVNAQFNELVLFEN